MNDLNALFTTKESLHTQKCLDYLDGNVHPYSIANLSNEVSGIYEWESRGFKPFSSNIVAPIVAKSGLLFIDGLPLFEVKNGNVTSDNETVILNQMFDKAHFQDTLQSLDQVVRLLKTAILLIQYDIKSARYVFEVLHRANAAVDIDPTTKEITKLVYKRHSNDPTVCKYRIYTLELVEDFEQELAPGSMPVKVKSQPNALGLVPAVGFYDTMPARVDFWNIPDRELVDLNDAFNRHQTMLDFAANIMINPMLVTNCSLEGEEKYGGSQASSYSGITARRTTSSTKSSLVAGLDKVLSVNSMGVDNPFLEYKTISVDLIASQALYDNMVKKASGHWSVVAEMDPSVQASGESLRYRFEENTKLVKSRQRMFEMSLNEVLTIIKAMMPGTFKDISTLDTTFSDPEVELTVELNDKIWFERIAQGVATKKDYLMQVLEYTEEQAVEKLLEISGNVPEAAELEVPQAPEVVE